MITSTLAHIVPIADLLQSSVYGKCIFTDYNNVHKDKCAAEFMKLKECYLVSDLFRLILEKKIREKTNTYTEGIQAKIVLSIPVTKKSELLHRTMCIRWRL